jgi:hypothetical protein
MRTLELTLRQHRLKAKIDWCSTTIFEFNVQTEKHQQQVTLDLFQAAKILMAVSMANITIHFLVKQIFNTTVLVEKIIFDGLHIKLFTNGCACVIRFNWNNLLFI